MVVWFNEDKQKEVLKVRGIDLMIVRDMILKGEIIAFLPHPSRKNQRMFVLLYNGYMIAVPVLPEENGFLIKSAWNSSEYDKKYNLEVRKERKKNAKK